MSHFRQQFDDLFPSIMTWFLTRDVRSILSLTREKVQLLKLTSAIITDRFNIHHSAGNWTGSLFRMRDVQPHEGRHMNLFSLIKPTPRPIYPSERYLRIKKASEEPSGFHPDQRRLLEELLLLMVWQTLKVLKRFFRETTQSTLFSSLHSDVRKHTTQLWFTKKERKKTGKLQ